MKSCNLDDECVASIRDGIWEGLERKKNLGLGGDLVRLKKVDLSENFNLGVIGLYRIFYILFYLMKETLEEVSI